MTSAKSSVFGFPIYLSFLWRSPHRAADSWCAGVPGVVGWVGGGVRRAYKADVSPWCNSGTWSGGAYVRMRAEDIVSIVQLKIKMFLKVNVFLADRIGRVDFSLAMLVNIYMNFIFVYTLVRIWHLRHTLAFEWVHSWNIVQILRWSRLCFPHICKAKHLFCHWMLI